MILEHRLHRPLQSTYALRFPPSYIDKFEERYRGDAPSLGLKGEPDGWVTKLATASALDEEVLWAADVASKETTGFPLSLAPSGTSHVFAEYPNEESESNRIGVAVDVYDENGVLTSAGWEPIRHTQEGAELPDYSTDPLGHMLDFTYHRRPDGLDVEINNPNGVSVDLTRLRLRGHPLRQGNSGECADSGCCGEPGGNAQCSSLRQWTTFSSGTSS